MTSEPLTTTHDTTAARLAELERHAGEQAQELERLRMRDPQTAHMRALMAPRAVSRTALEAADRQLAQIRMRQQAREAHAEQVREQEERDRPKRVARDRKLAAIRANRDAALARAEQAQQEADELSAKMFAIEREPLSPPIALPACLESRPLLVGPRAWPNPPKQRGRR